MKALKNASLFFLGVIFGEQKSPCGSTASKHIIISEVWEKNTNSFWTNIIWLKQKKLVFDKSGKELM